MYARVCPSARLYKRIYIAPCVCVSIFSSSIYRVLYAPVSCFAGSLPSIVEKKKEKGREGERNSGVYMRVVFSSSCRHLVTLYNCGWRKGGLELGPLYRAPVSMARKGMLANCDYRLQLSHLSGKDRLENRGGSPQSMSSPSSSSPAASPPISAATPNQDDGRRF